MDLLQAIALGSYAFTAGAYVFAWKLWQAVASMRVKLATLCEHFDNHLLHELNEIKRRLDHLER